MNAAPETLGDYILLERFPLAGQDAYLAEHRDDRRRVLIRCFPRAQADLDAWARFRRQALGNCRLDRCDIVRLFAVGEESARCYVALEYVDGTSLQDFVVSRGPLPPWEAARVIRAAALALQHAHEAGGVHRDLRPRKLLMEPSGAVKLLGMGLCTFPHVRIDTLNTPFDEFRTDCADYLAPEPALDSQHVDIRVDIYSLGCIFYFCLTGQPPYPEGTVAQKLIWHQVRQPAPVTNFRPDVPLGLLTILERMIAKNRGQRFHTPLEVVRALEQLWTSADRLETHSRRRSWLPRWFGRRQEPPAHSAFTEPGHLLRQTAWPKADYWSLAVHDLAQAAMRGEPCEFALHDALIDSGNAAIAEHFNASSGKHSPTCSILRAIQGLDG